MIMNMGLMCLIIKSMSVRVSVWVCLSFLTLNVDLSDDVDEGADVCAAVDVSAYAGVVFIVFIYVVDGVHEFYVCLNIGPDSIVGTVVDVDGNVGVNLFVDNRADLKMGTDVNNSMRLYQNIYIDLYVNLVSVGDSCNSGLLCCTKHIYK